jgi:hypothetical protein
MFRYVFSNFAFERFGQQLIDFFDEGRHLGDELDQAFRHKDHTVVFTDFRSGANDVRNLSCNLGQCHVFGFNFFADQHAINLGPQGALQGNMGG